jgi:hypothetical protein
MYRQDEEDTSFTNCSTVNHNVDNNTKKYRRTRITSPVIIQSYGNNNFAVESLNEKQKKNNEYYDKVFEDLKPRKIYKTKTNLISFCPDRSSTFYNTKRGKPLEKYKNMTNINDDYNDYVTYNNISYITEDKSYSKKKNETMIEDKTPNRQIFQKEEIDDLSYPTGLSILSHRKNKTHLNYHRFCSSFIPKNCKLKKRIAFKKCNIANSKKEKLVNIQKTPSTSKSKNQLEEFNIDKLKEIGDHLALKCVNSLNSRNKTNMKNSNINNMNNINVKNAFEEKEKHKENEFINNMMMIDQKRKNSKNKLVLINKIKNSLKKNDLSKLKLDGENKNRIKTLNENYILNSPQNKLMKVYNKSKELVNNNTQRYFKRIKVNGKFVRCKFKLKPIKSFKDDDKSSNFNMSNNTCQNNLRKNINYQSYYQLNDNNICDISNKENHKTFYNEKINYDINLNDKMLNLYTNNEYSSIRRKKSTYSNLGRFNLKSNKNTNESKYSFNNLFLP